MTQQEQCQNLGIAYVPPADPKTGPASPYEGRLDDILSSEVKNTGPSLLTILALQALFWVLLAAALIYAWR